MSEFDEAMSLTRDGDGQVARGHLAPGWAIGEAVNGGALMALAATALRHDIGADLDPLALSAYFLSATQPGDVEVTSRVLRQGRAFTTGECAIAQRGADGADVDRVRVLATFGSLADPGTAHRTIEAPPIAAPQDCLGADDAPREVTDAAPLVGRLDMRFDPPSAGWALGRPSGRGQLDAWVRFRDGREADTTALLFLLDALPPVAFDLGIMGWAPTIEFSGHVRARPAPGWLQMQTTTRVLTGALMEEDATIWDSTGTLVAQSRQLCGVRLPDGWSPPGR